MPHTFEIAETHHGEHMHLAVAGELDLASAPTLAERLRELHDAGEDVRLDLSAVSFMDSSGARVLSEAHDDAEERGRRLAITDELSPQVRRVFLLLRIEGLLEES